MQVFIKNGVVVAAHEDWQVVPADAYPGARRQLVTKAAKGPPKIDKKTGVAIPQPVSRPLEIGDPAPPVDLAEAKRLAKADVDDAAERERGKHITLGTGQALTYQRKVEEAKAATAAIEAGAEPDPASYPLLAASIGIDSATIAGVAAVVIDRDAAWARAGAEIEAARLAAKLAIDAAKTIEELEAVRPAWPP